MAQGRWYEDVLPFIAMVAAEFAIVGVNTLFKAASLKGLSYYVFIAYEYAINTLLLLPLTFMFCRKVELPSYNRVPVMSRIFLLSLIGFSAHVLGFKGIEYSSPTLASAMSNLVPAYTFILAIIFRMEKLDLRSPIFQAKALGTLLSLLGALVVVLYKGPRLLSFPSSTIRPHSYHWFLQQSQRNWLVGGLLLAAESFLFSIRYIILNEVMKMYPAELPVTFFNNLCLSIVAIPVCFLAEKDLSAWIPRSDTVLATFIFSGFFGPSFISIILSFSLRLKGPLYTAIFKPLTIVIAPAMGVIFLRDALHLGSVIGAFILCVGVYAVIWGKAKEDKMTGQHDANRLPFLSSNETPLLQSQ